jgi:pyrroline-5-carboxylate reductase
MSSKIDKIGFIGVGKMGRAMVASLIRSNTTASQNIICSDISAEQLESVQKEFKVSVTSDNKDVISNCGIVILAVKPQSFPQAVADLSSHVRADHIIVSIMAGIRIASIKAVLPGKVVRVMPNTAALVGQMAGGFAVADDLSDGDISRVKKILQCAGLAIEVTEEQLDAVTGLSGSGPAFVAYIIDAFIQVGIGQGLEPQTARQLTLKTFSGTAALLEQWNISPAELIRMVSSPNGTTVAGRQILESSSVTETIRQTVARATARSKELGK